MYSTPIVTRSFDHSWHIGDPVFTRDIVHTMRGDIDRHEIVTRRSMGGELSLITQ